VSLLEESWEEGFAVPDDDLDRLQRGGGREEYLEARRLTGRDFVAVSVAVVASLFLLLLLRLFLPPVLFLLFLRLLLDSDRPLLLLLLRLLLLPPPPDADEHSKIWLRIILSWADSLRWGNCIQSQSQIS